MPTATDHITQFVVMADDGSLNPHRQLRRLMAARARTQRMVAALVEAYTPERPAKTSRGACALNPAVKALVKESDGYCRYCVTGEAQTVDHILPWSRGGTNCPTNLVGCCRECNSTKGDLTPAEAGMVLDVPRRLAGRLDDSLLVAP